MDELEGIFDDDRPPVRSERPRLFVLRRTAMAAATAFLAINIWTGAPLIALWVGSQVVGQTALSMKAVFVVVVVLAALVFAMAFALAWLNDAYARLTGVPSREHRLTWLRSMNVEDDDEILVGMRVSVMERIVVASVYLAVAVFLLWFFFLAGSPLPG
jgi:hypothetical protein